jgi:hypothetical protein
MRAQAGPGPVGGGQDYEVRYESKKDRPIGVGRQEGWQHPHVGREASGTRKVIRRWRRLPRDSNLEIGKT